MTSLAFTVDSALLSELGEKLVESVHIALNELVKNSYDADSTEVTVRFIEKESGGPEVHVIDNGTGMTFDDVTRYWMRIATTMKADSPYSDIFGRPKTGSKGIGRFSCRRLGNQLKLITIARKRGNGRNVVYEKTEVAFPWTKFKAGTEVTKIRCPGNTQTVTKAKTGTTLIIDGSEEDEWSKRGYDFLKRQLAVLVANRGQKRPGYKEDPGFNIYLDVPRYEGETKDLREELISAGWGTINAHVDGGNRAVCRLNAMGIGTKNIRSERRFPHLKGVKLAIGIIPDLKEQMRDISVLSKGTLRQILPEWGGVQIRYKGFRVYPYGDDDWLNIDHDRGLRRSKPKDELYAFAQTLRGIDPARTLLQLLSMRSHVGNVEIGPSAKGFELKANREGFIHSEALDELQGFVRFCIDWATMYRDHYLRIRLKQKAEEALEGLEEAVDKHITSGQVVEKAVGYINDEIYRLAVYLPKKEKGEVKNKIKKATDAIARHEQTSQEELRHLRLIASTSTLLMIFAHEVKSLLGSLETSASLVKTIEDKLVEADSKLMREVREGLQFSKARFVELMDMTSLIGFSKKEAQPGKLALYERIKTAERCFRLIVNEYDIAVTYNDVPRNIMVKSLLESELYVIILNLLSNSIKAVIAGGGERRIDINARRKNGKTLMIIRDTGIGLHENEFNDIFVPFVADPSGRLYEKLDKELNPEDKFIVGTGSGLGLSIVKEILEARQSSIYFTKPEGLWKTKLEIVIP